MLKRQRGLTLAPPTVAPTVTSSISLHFVLTRHFLRQAGRKAGLLSMQSYQQADFEGLFKAMDGPVLVPGLEYL